MLWNSKQRLRCIMGVWRFGGMDDRVGCVWTVSLLISSFCISLNQRAMAMSPTITPFFFSVSLLNPTPSSQYPHRYHRTSLPWPHGPNTP